MRASIFPAKSETYGELPRSDLRNSGAKRVLWDADEIRSIRLFAAFETPEDVPLEKIEVNLTDPLGYKSREESHVS